MSEPEVLFKQIPALRGNIGVITLNRPYALNALSGEMIYAMTAQLSNWAADPSISVVIIHGAGDRAFCAGGDLKVVYNYGPNNYTDGIHFYEEEYKLNLLIYNYPKPYIALLNGVAMGGGLGISMHSARIVATENLLLAMPETGIGFFPDVGAGYFFQRCPHKIGMYLGLTGSVIGIADALFAKLVHAYIPSNNLSNIITDLATYDLTKNPLAKIDTIISKYQHSTKPGSLQQYISIIEECFSKGSIEAIIAALKNNGTAWAKQQVNILNSRSPTSLKVAFKVLTMEANMTLVDALRMEQGLTLHMLKQHDIYEGIRAVIIDKTHDARWQPPTLQEVKDSDIDQLFS